MSFPPFLEVGDYCLISSNVHVPPGTVVGNSVVVGMGATIAGKLLEPGLYVQPERRWSRRTWPAHTSNEKKDMSTPLKPVDKTALTLVAPLSSDRR